MSREQLCRVVTIFSHGWHGLIAIAQYRGIVFPVSKIEFLEDLLAKNLRYFCMFVSPEYEVYELVGTEPVDRLNSFHADLKAGLVDLVAGMNIALSEFLDLPLMNNLYVQCNLLPVIRAQKKPSSHSVELLEGYLDKHLANLGISDSQALEEKKAEAIEQLEKKQALVALVSESANSLIKRKASSQIGHPVIASFWERLFRENGCGPTSVFVKAFRDSLVASGLPHELQDEVVELLGDRLGEAELIDTYTVAKLFRFVPRCQNDLMSLFAAFGDAYSGESRTFALLPPLPKTEEEVFFSTGEEEMMTELLASAGWVGIHGHSRAGKSCRLLHILHKLLAAKKDIDVVWVDFKGVHCETDGLARLASQLFLRRCNTKDAISHELHSILSDLQPNSIVVFDNIEPGVRSWVKYIKALISNLQTYTEVCFVVVAEDLSSMVPDEFEFHRVLEVAMLTPAVAHRMATSFNPIDYASKLIAIDSNALVIASYGMAGNISQLVMSCSLASLRQLASDVLRSKGDSALIRAAYVNAASRTFHGLTHDEKLLACCLYPHAAHFDEGLSCAMSRGVFDSDSVRWRLAWNGLLSVGWVSHSSELGYIVSKFAALVQPSSTLISAQSLFDSYALHLANEIKRINESASDSPCLLEEFSRRLPHFSTFLEAMFFRPLTEAEDEVRTSSRHAARHLFSVSSVPVDISKSRLTAASRVECIKTLAGHFGRVLSYHMSPQSGMQIALITMQDVARVADVAALANSEPAAVDYAEQCLRSGSCEDGLKYCSPVVTRILAKQSERDVRPVPYATRALVVYSRLLLASSKPAEASPALDLAMKLFNQKGVTKKNSWEFGLVVRLQAEARMQVALLEVSAASDEKSKSKKFFSFKGKK